MSYELIAEVAFHPLLFLAIFLCALVAGFLFAFAVVVMPGLKKLSNRSFILAFQGIDGVIQHGQPLFTFVWVGSIVTLIACTIAGYGRIESLDYGILVLAMVTYFFGVQASTVLINIPLNNQLQKLDVTKANEAELDSARNHFESRWNTWNVRRTAVACAATAFLMTVG